MAARAKQLESQPVEAATRAGNGAWTCALLLSLAWAGAAQAQIYKWVDAQGKPHYSDNKADAGKFKSEQLKVPAAGAAPPPARASAAAPHWSSPGPATPEEQPQAAVPKRPRSLSGGREDGSDASRCALARDVLSGSVRHGNGKPTDKYDLEVAQNDVKMFCR